MPKRNKKIGKKKEQQRAAVVVVVVVVAATVMKATKYLDYRMRNSSGKLEIVSFVLVHFFKLFFGLERFFLPVEIILIFVLAVFPPTKNTFLFLCAREREGIFCLLDQNVMVVKFCADHPPRLHHRRRHHLLLRCQ